MRGCAQVLAVLAALLFVVTAVFNLLALNLAQVFTDRAAIKTALSKSGAALAVAAPDVLADIWQQQALAEGLPTLPVSTDVVIEAVTVLAPPDWVSSQTDPAVDALFDALETGELTTAAVELDALGLLERARGEPGRQAVSVIINNLPVCTDPAAVLTPPAPGALPTCLPPAINPDALTQQVHTVLVQTLDQNPQIQEQARIVRLPLLESEQATPQAQAQFQRAHQLFWLAQRASWSLWLLPLGCLLLILLLVVRSPGEWGRWWGWPLLGAALTALFFALVLPAFLTLLLRTAVPAPSAAGGLLLPLDQIFGDLAQPLLSAWQRRVLTQSGIMLVAGLFLLLVGLLGRRERADFGGRYA